MHKRLPANGVTKVQGVWFPKRENGQLLQYVYHHHCKGGPNDKEPLDSDHTLADVKLAAARQVCKQYSPFALVPWSATLEGCRKRIRQLGTKIPEKAHEKVARLDLLDAYKKGFLEEGTFADISTSSKFDTYFPLNDFGVEAADIVRGLKKPALVEN